ncbi:hypothetical protein D9M72_511590 [compost metagenome]
MVDEDLFVIAPEPIHRLNRRRELSARIAPQRHEGLLHRGEEIVGLFVRIGGDAHDTDHDMRLVERLGRREALAIDLQRRKQHVWREMRCEGEGKAEHAGEVSAEMA